MLRPLQGSLVGERAGCAMVGKRVTMGGWRRGGTVPPACPLLNLRALLLHARAATRLTVPLPSAAFHYHPVWHRPPPCCCCWAQTLARLYKWASRHRPRWRHSGRARPAGGPPTRARGLWSSSVSAVHAQGLVCVCWREMQRVCTCPFAGGHGHAVTERQAAAW